MNEQETEIAKVLLENMKAATANDVCAFATAYQMLAQAALSRTQASATVK